MIEALTALLVAITGFYAFVTFQMLKVNQAAVAAVREQIESSLRPYLTVAVMIEQFPIFHLRIDNEGKTSATSCG